MQKYKLKTSKRDIIGRKVKNLRQEGKLPGNIYGKKVKSQAVEVNTKEFEKVFQQAGETSIVELILCSLLKGYEFTFEGETPQEQVMHITIMGTVKEVLLDVECFAVCFRHALASEREENMGLLLGDVEVRVQYQIIMCVFELCV